MSGTPPIQLRVLHRAACLLLLVVVTCCSERYSAPAPPEGLLADPAHQVAGRTLFQKHCASCHGGLEEGRLPTASTYSPPPATLTHPRYRTLDPAYLYWRISEGNRVEPYRSRGSVMPAWGPHLAEEEIWQLVAYLRIRPAASR